MVFFSFKNLHVPNFWKEISSSTTPKQQNSTDKSEKRTDSKTKKSTQIWLPKSHYPSHMWIMSTNPLPPTKNRFIQKNSFIFHFHSGFSSLMSQLKLRKWTITLMMMIMMMIVGRPYHFCFVNKYKFFYEWMKNIVIIIIITRMEFLFFVVQIG